MDPLDQILAELRELRRLIEAPAEKPDDLVTAAYIAARTELSERTILEGKAGTSAIPRVELKAEGATRPLIRFQRAAADRWIRGRAATALTKQPRRRALHLVKRAKKRRRAS